MSKRYDVLVVGRPTWDLVFTGLPNWPVIGQEVFAANLTVSPGGTFNGVAALARLGVAVGMIGTVGDDEWSALGLQAMRAEGVSTEHIAILDQPMPAVSVCMTYGGDRGFLTYEPSDPALNGRCVTHALEMLRTLDASYIQCCLNTDLAAYARVAHERDVKTVVDCGWDEPWLTSREIRTLMPRADIVFMNQLEALTITGESDIERALVSLGTLAGFVVVKRSEQGSSAVVDGQVFHVPGITAHVVDATGAGDCFNAGFLYGLLQDRPIEECLRYGNICGAQAVTKPGGFAGAPTRDDLLTIAGRLAHASGGHEPGQDMAQ
jgi:sugar/nucleoside kinase (ribokinase family)